MALLNWLFLFGMRWREGAEDLVKKKGRAVLSGVRLLGRQYCDIIFVLLSCQSLSELSNVSWRIFAPHPVFSPMGASIYQWYIFRLWTRPSSLLLLDSFWLSHIHFATYRLMLQNSVKHIVIWNIPQLSHLLAFVFVFIFISWWKSQNCLWGSY